MRAAPAAMRTSDRKVASCTLRNPLLIAVPPAKPNVPCDNWRSRFSRNYIVSMIQGLIPPANNDLTELAGKIIFDKVAAKEADTYWKKEELIYGVLKRRINADILSRQLSNKPVPEELRKRLHGVTVMEMLCRDEGGSEAKISMEATNYGGAFNSIGSIFTGFSEIDNDESFSETIRQRIIKANPFLRPYAQIDQQISEQIRGSKERALKRKEASKLEQEAMKEFKK